MSASIHTSNGQALGSVDWVRAAHSAAAQGERCMLIFVTEHQGSTPRETGTWMLIDERQCLGTLGGGEVERMVIAEARDLLAGKKEWCRSNEKFQLGPDLGQCCGGTMTVLFEPVDETSLNWLSDAVAEVAEGYILFPVGDLNLVPQVMSGEFPENLSPITGGHIQSLVDERPRVVLYGGGHVGRAIAAVAAQMPVHLEVVDERREVLEDIPLALNVTTVHRDNPPSHAKELTGADAVLIMTHSHGLDYRLCQMLIGKTDISYLGLIGSATKAARFINGLSKEGCGSEKIAHLTCPIGRGGPVGKEPGVIAIAAWSEIMQVLRSARAENVRETRNIKHVKRDR